MTTQLIKSGFDVTKPPYNVEQFVQFNFLICFLKNYTFCDSVVPVRTARKSGFVGPGAAPKPIKQSCPPIANDKSDHFGGFYTLLKIVGFVR